MARTRLAERTTAQKVTVTPAAGAVFAALAAVLVLGPAMKFVAVVSTLSGLWLDSAYGRIMDSHSMSYDLNDVCNWCCIG